MKNLLSLIIFYLVFSFSVKAQITLTHNVGSTPIKTDWEPCEYQEYWARTFTLSDFGITTTDQFIIRSGQVAISNSYEGALIGIDVFGIDDDFPNSELIVIGIGAVTEAPEIGDTPETLNIQFTTPIVVPSGIKKILVVASQDDDTYNPDFKRVLIAGTQFDNDQSWFQGCREHYSYVTTEDLDTPVPNANFYINVTGEKLSTINTDSNINLTHNIGDNVFKTQMHSCTAAYQYWARKFVLNDFGVDENEKFIIEKGFVGLSRAEWLSSIQFNIYKIDENFPSSFSQTDLIGSSQIKEVPYFSSTDNSAKIMLVDFETPIVVPEDVKMILVEVHKGIVYGDGEAFIAGTDDDTGDSWYKGCGYSGQPNTYSTLNSMNFFITVNGKPKTIFPFEIETLSNCINTEIDLNLTNQINLNTVIWNFNDPSSGINNTSTQIDTSHQFSSPGIYNITANVLHMDGTNYTINKEVEIFDAPNINSTVSLKQCDNIDINGFSSINLNEAKAKIITNPDDYIITFFEEKALAESNSSNFITNSTAYTNQNVSNDIVWARIENTEGCFRVSEVNLVVSTTEIPANFQKSFYICENGTNIIDGIATFDFSEVTQEVKNEFPANQQLIITYYENEADALAETNEISDISNYQNTNSPNQQIIYVRVDSQLDNDCLGLGAHITLNVETVPVANSVIIDPECDNDRDGLFAFNTSTIQTTIIGTQTNVAVSYFDSNGTQLSSPLPNPFSTASQTITVRVVNTTSQDLNGQCYDETTINFVVNTVPIANLVPPQEECDTDTDGVFAFDTSSIESTILGNQTGLIVKYFDQNDVALPSPLPNPFNTASQKIRVRLENPIYDICYEETTVDFIVREKPTVRVIDEDIICMTNNPQLQIGVENSNVNYSYTWRDENNMVVGNSANTTVSKGGKYTVIATSIYGCNSDQGIITIRESAISTININDIEVQDDSENNYIKINTSNLGLGNYEFRLLDSNSNILVDYQDDPNFENLDGGNYIVEVNDKNGCGSILFEVSLISFPKFFTPNADGKNDFWQINGIDKGFYKSGQISVFDRFGNPITKFTINDIGWDGTYNSKILTTNDYWFHVVLINRNDQVKKRSGHFSLLRR